MDFSYKKLIESLDKVPIKLVNLEGHLTSLKHNITYKIFLLDLKKFRRRLLIKRSLSYLTFRIFTVYNQEHLYFSTLMSSLYILIFDIRKKISPEKTGFGHDHIYSLLNKNLDNSDIIHNSVNSDYFIKNFLV